MTRVVLILGSAPDAIGARDWPRAPFTDIVAINNAWRIRGDYDFLIHPEDLPENRRPQAPTGQVITAEDYVPIQNRYGGFVYAGGTMAFTAGYWALGALQPDVMAFFGCNMVYAASGKTHFYGKGEPDPLRRDVTLRSLEAKSARLMILAAEQGCACVNLSDQDSRLVFPRSSQARAAGQGPRSFSLEKLRAAKAKEAELQYMVPSGRYWLEEERFDPGEIDALDALWLEAAQ